MEHSLACPHSNYRGILTPLQHIYPLSRVFHLTGCLICRLWFLPTFHWINRQRGSVLEQSRQDLLGNLSLSSGCFPTSAWQWKVFLLLSLQPLKLSACVSLRVEGREEAQVREGAGPRLWCVIKGGEVPCNQSQPLTGLTIQLWLI